MYGTKYATTIYLIHGGSYSLFSNDRTRAIMNAQEVMERGAVGAVVKENGKEIFIDYKG